MDRLPEVCLLDELLRQHKTLATAESCTGGWLSKRITDLAGCSATYLGGVVSYCDRVKQEVLGVPSELLLKDGAASESVAKAMAEGVRRLIGSDLGVGITGIAGPDGDGSDKPAGLVYIAVCDASRTVATEFHFVCSRETVRIQACNTAIAMLMKLLEA